MCPFKGAESITTKILDEDEDMVDVQADHKMHRVEVSLKGGTLTDRQGNILSKSPKKDVHHVTANGWIGSG